MKIIISPSKTQQLKSIPKIEVKKPITLASHERMLKTDSLLKILSTIDLEPLFKEKALHYKAHYLKFEDQLEMPSIQSYTGLVFKQLNLSNYSTESLQYLNQHLIILSSLYGATAPFEMIRPYRLDFKSKVGSVNLYDHWHDFIRELLSNETPIIDLASNEYSKMVDVPKISIHFRENDQGNLINKATFSKMARGKMLHIMIDQQIKTIKALKAIAFDGYAFNASISNSNNFYYTRQNLSQKL